MLLANIYLLIWHHDKLKYILPFSHKQDINKVHQPQKRSNKFPILFFAGVLMSFVFVVLFARFGNEVMPRNSYTDCIKQFDEAINKENGIDFCACIHHKGNPLNACLGRYAQKK